MLGDIRDAEHVAASVEGVDVVLHLAALIAIPYSYVAPRSYVETNVTGTLNVLEAVRRHGRRGWSTPPPRRSTARLAPCRSPRSTPLRGQSPYSASKIAADKLCESYALSFGTPVTVLRPFNTFGPRQSARAVIPTVLAQLLAGATELRLGSLTPKRDFTFVTDTALGFVRAAVADVEPGTAVQLGTGRTDSIGEIVDMARRITGSDAAVVVDEERVRPAGSEVEIAALRPQPGARPDRLDSSGGPRDGAAAHGRVDRQERRPREGSPVPPMSVGHERSAPGAPGPAGTIPLATPNLGAAERQAVLAALDSGFVSSVGP